MKLFLKRNHLRIAYATGLLVLTLAFSNVYGDIFITASESEAGVTIRWSGSLDLTDLTSAGNSPAPNGSVFPKMGMLSGSSKQELDVYLFSNLQLRPFGSGGGTIQSKASGDCLLLTDSAGVLCVCLPSGYSGGPLAGGIFFANTTLTSLGIDASSPFFYDLGGQFISFFGHPEAFAQSPQKPVGMMLSKVFAPLDEKVEIDGGIFKKKRQTRKIRIPTASDLPSVEVRPLKPKR